MTDIAIHDEHLDPQRPSVPHQTYFCFTPDQIERVLASWSPFNDDTRDELLRSGVRAFLYSVNVDESGIRKEAPGVPGGRGQ